jgi:simple sugar transport system permease protein
MASVRSGAWRHAAEALAIPIGALAAAMVVFGIFTAALGQNPLEIYALIYKGAFASAFSWQNTLSRAAPLVLTALCVALPAQAGLMVIGGEGAVVLGGLAAAVAGHLLSAVALFNHFVEGPLRDPSSLNKPSTTHIGDVNMLGNLPGLDIHWGLAYGVVFCAAMYVLVRYTTFGFALRIVGGNPRAARLAGLPVGRLVLIACLLGGAAAGLAGAVEVAAVHGSANASLIAGYGYARILSRSCRSRCSWAVSRRPAGCCSAGSICRTRPCSFCKASRS